MKIWCVGNATAKLRDPGFRGCHKHFLTAIKNIVPYYSGKGKSGTATAIVMPPVMPARLRDPCAGYLDDSRMIDTSGSGACHAKHIRIAFYYGSPSPSYAQDRRCKNMKAILLEKLVDIVNPPLDSVIPSYFKAPEPVDYWLQHTLYTEATIHDIIEVR